MNKPIAVMKVAIKQFKALRDLAQHIYDNMNGNPNFPTPSPTMPTLLGAINALSTAISDWGPKGNRGSHQDYVDLLGAATAVHSILTELTGYCMSVVDLNATPEVQTSFLLSSGFPLKNAATPQGVLEMVQNFRRFISRQLNADEVKFKWSKPLNLKSKSNVKSYNIYRGESNSIALARVVGSPTATSFIDAPGPGRWFYWVVPVNTAGEGVVSGVVIVFVPPTE